MGPSLEEEDLFCSPLSSVFSTPHQQPAIQEDAPSCTA